MLEWAIVYFKGVDVFRLSPMPACPLRRIFAFACKRQIRHNHDSIRLNPALRGFSVGSTGQTGQPDKDIKYVQNRILLK